MSMLEDRVRQALRETAEEITPLDVPPLRLSSADGRSADGRGPAGRGRRWRGRRAGWPGWLIPLAAAAAVAAVLAGTLTLANGWSGHRPASGYRALPGLPRYYVELANTRGQRGWPQRAVIRATATGQIVATVAAPRADNAFLMVAAASGAGRYVLAAQRMAVKHERLAILPGPGKTARHQRSVAIQVPAGPIRFYQFSIGSSGQVSAPRLLRALALPAGTSLTGLALTPDGRKLAVASQPPRPGRDPEIQVDTLATGAQRAWTWPGGQPIEESTGGTGSALSWAADDSTLAFQRWVDDRFQVRLLDTTAPGSSLAASRVALRLKWDGSGNRFHHGRAVNDVQTFAALLTPDGSKIVTATDTQTLRPVSAELAFTEFSVLTGKVVAVRDRWRLAGHWPEQEEQVLWSNADGSTLVVVAHRPGAGAGSRGDFPIQFGVLRGNRYTPLPGAPSPNQLSVGPAW
jgi:hypothetical protein